jgi:1-acyl-sn-glycerol-3-phosphate acyltransferase
MILVRSVLFALVLALITPPYALFALLIFWASPHTRHRLITTWVPITMWFITHLLGIRYRVLGAEHIPKTPCVILSKHQSAWETIALQVIFPHVCFVLKRELLRLPFFGWALARIPCIAIDRAAGRDALAQILEQGKQRLAEGFSVVVFPEGTRVAPGERKRYKSGGAWFAHQTGVLAVPVAHNAGEFWRKNAFLKHPGEITVSIGPPIDTTQMDTAAVHKASQTWIENEMRRLFPHHYANPASSSPSEIP